MKGVNKLVVEIKDTESEYFDRAILFLKPGKLNAGQTKLNDSAMRLLNEVGRTAQRKSRKNTVLLVCGAAAAVILAVALGIILSL